MWFSTGSGRIELELTKEQAQQGHHQGACDSDIVELKNVPAIREQLDKIDPQLLASELKEWGAWDKEELSNHEDNLERILWLACGDITEQD